jgi:membrane protease YdiL (CAAX protease family)
MPPLTALDTLRQLADSITVVHLVSLVGIGLFATWLIRTSLGRRSLVRSRPRRHSMSLFTPFVPFAVWLVGISLLQSVVATLTGPVEGERKALQSNVTFCVGAVLTIALIVPLAAAHFARGLKGFGFRLRTIPRDMGVASVDLLAVWPLVLAMIVLTTRAGRIVRGPSFEMPQHQELELMVEFPAIAVQILIMFLAVVIAPLMEEMLFRGLLQSTIRAYVGRPWPAIAITSLLFALVHQYPEHWPALFVLAMGLGYSYEKSGSLFQPIFMHALFNGVTIAAALGV